MSDEAAVVLGYHQAPWPQMPHSPKLRVAGQLIAIVPLFQTVCLGIEGGRREQTETDRTEEGDIYGAGEGGEHKARYWA